MNENNNHKKLDYEIISYLSRSYETYTCNKIAKKLVEKFKFNFFVPNIFRNCSLPFKKKNKPNIHKRDIILSNLIS